MSARLATAGPGAPPSELYAPFAAAVDALGALPCGAVGRPGRRVETTVPAEPLQAAASRMGWRKVGALAVLDGDELVGALSEDDLLRMLAQRLGERVAEVEDAGEAIVVWEQLLDGLTVADAMSPRKDLPTLPPSAPLLDGIEMICAATAHGTRFRYLWLLDERGGVAGAVSIRDVARGLTRLYDGDLSADAFPSRLQYEEARAAVGVILDLPIGGIRTRLALGHAPSLIRADASGHETVLRMWNDRRGYVLTQLRDGAPLGIATRRDLLRGLRGPFVSLGGLSVGRLMTAQVKCVSDTNTLCGLFKLMAIEGCRHMPLIDGTDRVVRMISMWEGVALFAPHRGSGH